MIVVPKDIATDAAELPFVSLEVTCHANSALADLLRNVGSPKKRYSAVRGRIEALACLPAEHDVHVLTAPPTDADPAGHDTQLDPSTA